MNNEESEDMNRAIIEPWSLTLYCQLVSKQVTKVKHWEYR